MDGLELSWVTEDKEQKPTHSARFRVRNGMVQVLTGAGNGSYSWTRIQVPPPEWRAIVRFIARKLKE